MYGVQSEFIRSSYEVPSGQRREKVGGRSGEGREKVLKILDNLSSKKCLIAGFYVPLYNLQFKKLNFKVTFITVNKTIIIKNKLKIKV